MNFSNQELMPLSNPNQLLDPETGELKPIIYREGQPQQYRLNLKDGILNLNGNQNLTNKGQSFEFIPVAYRQFKDELFNRPFMNWAEIFFINAVGHLGSFMVNNHNVEQFDHCIGQAVTYGNLEIGQFKMKLELIPRSNAKGNYFMAAFEVREEQVLSKEDAELYQVIVTDLLEKHPHIYRRDTVQGSCKMIETMNYSTPFEEEQEETKTAELPAPAEAKKAA